MLLVKNCAIMFCDDTSISHMLGYNETTHFFHRENELIIIDKLNNISYSYNLDNLSSLIVQQNRTKFIDNLDESFYEHYKKRL